MGVFNMSVTNELKELRLHVQESIPLTRDAQYCLSLRSGYSMQEIQDAISSTKISRHVAILEDVAQVLDDGIPMIFSGAGTHPIKSYRLGNELSYAQAFRRIFGREGDSSLMRRWEEYEAFPSRAVATTIAKGCGVPLEMIPHVLTRMNKQLPIIHWRGREWLYIPDYKPDPETWYEDVDTETLRGEK